MTDSLTVIDDTRATAGGPLTSRPHSHGLVPTGSPAERFMSRTPDDFEEPSVRVEDWKFAPLRTLRPLLAGTPSDAQLRLDSTVPAGVELLTVAADDAVVQSVPQPTDRLGALAWDLSGDALVVRVPDGLEVAEPILLELAGDDTNPLVWNKIVIDLGVRSRATVIIEYTGLAKYAAVTSALVGDGASLDLVQIQNWDTGSLHNDHVGARLGAGSSYRHVSISLGGTVARLTPTVAFAGPGAKAELVGLAFAGPGQYQEARLYVDHSVPDCQSNVLYKTALEGDTSRTAWVGDVRIRPAATGTQTYELNRNLLLADGARADSVPNLEIETGEIVSAGHASATGRFDDLQLFYLQSRGIPEVEARKLVVRGFFVEVLNHIALTSLRERLLRDVETRLGAS
ncbi:MAG: FeS assembly protein SufD [Pseudonocardiales bacterium]|nr:FeS assembly protein SufD [Pseudonocardiales bacterium]